MAWGAIAMAGLGFASGILDGASQRSAAKARNREQEKIIEARYERDMEEYEFNWQRTQADYAWALANTEAERYQDRVREADYNAQKDRIIDSALMNLELNTEALRDQYVVSEQLRAIQEGMSLDNDMANEQLKLNDAMVRARFDAADNSLRSMSDVAAYMNSIKQQGLEADQLLAAKQNEGKNIQEQIVIGEQLDTLQRDAQSITALLDTADKRAGMIARQGGSNSARNVAMNSMKAFGRSYAELKAQQADRRRSLNNYNGQIAGETAVQFAQIATTIEEQARNIGVTQAQAGLNVGRIKTTAESARSQYNLNANYRLNQYNRLTIPSFELAAREGNRQYKSLVSNTINELKAASVPYRNAIIFDPRKPVKGLEPVKGMMTKAQAPGWGSILAGSVIKGAQGAFSMSYTDEDGNIRFR